MGHLKKNHSLLTALLAGRDNQALGDGDKIIQTFQDGTTYQKQRLLEGKYLGIRWMPSLRFDLTSLILKRI
jgi:hypothetical protein